MNASPPECAPREWTARFWSLSGLFLAIVVGCSVFVAIKLDERSRFLLESQEAANSAAVRALEELRRYPLDEVYSSIEASHEVDGGPRRFFPVPALAAGQGAIVLFNDETLATTPDANFVGLPMDLNGDGDAVDRVVTEGFRLLPVRVTISWESRGQPREVFYHAVLSRAP